MTEQEKAAIPKALVLNAPGVDGPINVELIKTLWTNPSPTSDFAAQNITLSSSDYDLLIWIVRNSTSDSYDFSSISQKSDSCILSMATWDGKSIYRSTTYISNTSFYIDNCTYDGSTSVNSLCVPVAIYGIKSSITVDVSAVISDVSTDADKCMLSDGVTSVGNILDKGSVEVISDGVKTLSQIYDDLFALIDNSKVNEHTKMDGITTDGTHYISFIDTYSTTLYRFTAVGTSYPSWGTTSVSIVSSGSSSTECTISNGVISQAITSSAVVPAGIIYRVIY